MGFGMGLFRLGRICDARSAFVLLPTVRVFDRVHVCVGVGWGDMRL